jgi:hypothetical protein
MKEKDIKVDFREQQIILYAEKEDGSLSPVQTGSYITKNYINDFYEMTAKIHNEMTEKLKAGEISPVFFFMTIEELNVAELASRAGLSKSKVKKHLDLKGFQEARVTDLVKYANAFNIQVANFFQIIKTREDKKWDPGFRDDPDNPESVIISQTSTNNPLVVETKIFHNTK